MNPKSKTSSFLFLFVTIAFFVGIFIGLVVLGWGLWPVNWTGGSFDTLNLADQQNFLRAAIESYAYNPDAAIAQQRYTALGNQKERVLSDILANPGNLEKADVEKFADVVKSSSAPMATSAAVATPGPVTTPVTAPAKSPVTSLLNLVSKGRYMLNICLAAGMVIVVVLVILLLFRSRRKKKSAKIEQQSTGPMGPGDAGIFGGISSQGQSGEAKPADAKTYTDTAIDTAIPVKTDLPDWLREASVDNQPSPTETKIETPSVELSDSDIKEITTSKFSTLESKPVTSSDSGEFNQALISSGAFVPDGPEKSDIKAKPVAQSVKHEPLPVPGEKISVGQESQAETMAKFSRDIELTPGIDPEDAKKLRSIGITAPLLLLKKGASPQGRQSIAAGLGVPEMQVLKWVNYIDLLRIKGLTIEDAQMLKTTGVDILVELATRDPENLLEKLVASSKQANPSYKIPSPAQVQNWITQARSLPRIVSYS
jgi:hypothetical protein